METNAAGEGCTPDGHQYRVVGVDLKRFGGAMTLECRICGELVFSPAENYRRHMLDGD
ncbi:hypothetical protein [Citricoccus sp. NR2]|uniref:hypothetical protein n=1 Tax=Citricoccus sp. NR2 TaxID=3004095 RepID=UPI0022DD4476|nr:hypothetical protein [Citricoccus sp. NR2]WBL18510.1 hypothetical protein O1A05_12185 [Citricoccus sp. NR2]